MIFRLIDYIQVVLDSEKCLKTHCTPYFMSFPKCRMGVWKPCFPSVKNSILFSSLPTASLVLSACGLVWCRNCYFWHVPVDTGHSFNQSNCVSQWEGDWHLYRGNCLKCRLLWGSELLSFFSCKSHFRDWRMQSEQGGKGWQQPL